MERKNEGTRFADRDQPLMTPNIKTLILDFDGTIVESVGIKDRAFRVLFQEYGDRIDEIMRYHLAHNATIRFDKFRHITENILKKKYTGATERELSERFSHLVFQNIVDCPFVDGAVEFLDFFARKIPLYLATVSPPDELDRILDARRIKWYFKKVYTFPWSKEAALRDILSCERLSSAEAVFIGDSFEDYEAARAAGIAFIGRTSGKSFGGAAAPVYKNLAEIKSVLCRR